MNIFNKTFNAMRKRAETIELTAINLMTDVRDSSYMVPVPVSDDNLLYRCLLLFQNLGKVGNVLRVAIFTSIYKNASKTDDTATTFVELSRKIFS